MTKAVGRKASVRTQGWGMTLVSHNDVPSQLVVLTSADVLRWSVVMSEGSHRQRLKMVTTTTATAKLYPVNHPHSEKPKAWEQRDWTPPPSLKSPFRLLV